MLELLDLVDHFGVEVAHQHFPLIGNICDKWLSSHHDFSQGGLDLQHQDQRHPHHKTIDIWSLHQELRDNHLREDIDE